MGLARMMAMLGLDSSQYEAGFKRVESFSTGAAKRISGNVKGHLAAAFSIGAVTMYARSLIEAGGRIKDLSDKIGVSAETLQEWEYAAKQSGAELDDFARAFAYLARTNPSRSTAELLKEFNALADAVQSGKLGSGEIKAVNDALGKSGIALIPAFKSGLRGMADEARRLGFVLSNDVVASLDEMGDSLQRLSAQMRGPAATALVNLFSLLAKGANEIAMLANATVKAWKSNPSQLFTSFGGQLPPIASGGGFFDDIATNYLKDKKSADFAAMMKKASSSLGGGMGIPGLIPGESSRYDWARTTSGGNVAIGAYSGVNPLIVAQKETNTKLDKINKTLERIQADGSIPT